MFAGGSRMAFPSVRGSKAWITQVDLRRQLDVAQLVPGKLMFIKYSSIKLTGLHAAHQDDLRENLRWILGIAQQPAKFGPAIVLAGEPEYEKSPVSLRINAGISAAEPNTRRFEDLIPRNFVHGRFPEFGPEFTVRVVANHQ